MVLFAFSMEDQVEKYGAYVGIAAFFGLAVLSLLYFSQARELKRLREWAGRAPERAQELEQRVVAQAAASVAGGRRPDQAAAAQGTGTGALAPPRRLAEMPAQTAAGGATATAVGVAERTGTNGAGPVPALGPGGTVPAGRVNGSPEVAEEQAPEEPGETRAFDAAEAAAATGGPPPAAPAPAGSAPAGDATASAPAPAPVPRATPAQRVGVAPKPAPLRETQPSATTRSSGGGGRRPAAPAARRAPARSGGGRSAGTIALLVGLAVLILGGGAFVGSQLLGGDDTPPPPNQAAPPSSTSTGTSGNGQSSGGDTASTPPKAETNVAVLNGTTFTGLAGRLADEVAGDGYQRGTTQTNTRDQTIEQSVVFYADGYRNAARNVGKLLSIDQAEPLDSETAAVAPGANVVVLAGADQAP
jgi:hypothetical protein